MKLTPIKKNMTEVEIAPLCKVLFSYKTPVAASIDGQYYRTSTKYSATTTRHINAWLNGAEAVERDQTFFDSIVEVGK